MIVHASISENGNAGWDGKAKAGDQTGREVCVRSYYAFGNVMLRYKDSKIAAKASEIAVKLANSGLVGYDQSQRNTLYAELKKNNFDVDKYIKSGVKTETDCSAFQFAVYACLITAMRQDGNAPTTSTMRNFFSKHGFTVYTDSKYLKSDEYLKKGDVLVKEGSHTVQIITNGAKSTSTTTTQTTSTAQTTSKSLYSGSFPTLPSRGYFKSGDKGNQIKLLQKFLNWYGGYKLTVDGEYGTKTVNAVKNFQTKEKLTVDGEFGSKSLQKAKTIKR